MKLTKTQMHDESNVRQFFTKCIQMGHYCCVVLFHIFIMHASYTYKEDDISIFNTIWLMQNRVPKVGVSTLFLFFY